MKELISFISPNSKPQGEKTQQGERNSTPSNTKSHMVKFKQQALALAKATPVEQHPTRLHP